MVRAVWRAASLFVLFGCQWIAGGQELAPELSAYQIFFDRVLRSHDGEPSAITSIVPQAIGLSQRETKALKNEATRCSAELSALSREQSKAVLEARLKSIARDTLKTPLEPILAREVTRREAVLRVHIQRLKSAFGDERFQVLDAYVQSRPSFTPPPQGPAPVKKM